MKTLVFGYENIVESRKIYGEVKTALDTLFAPLLQNLSSTTFLEECVLTSDLFTTWFPTFRSLLETEGVDLSQEVQKTNVRCWINATGTFHDRGKNVTFSFFSIDNPVNISVGTSQLRRIEQQHKGTFPEGSSLEVVTRDLIKDMNARRPHIQVPSPKVHIPCDDERRDGGYAWKQHPFYRLPNHEWIEMNAILLI
ncbi:hypothetical protein BJ165DRAFT_1401988 [Panaeolus papilionaceus]|nr:hypothetical protein BJ165DRAFT_1401988 [Panaeolus papilionaceus]